MREVDHRMLFNDDAERGVIGGVLLEPRRMQDVASVLSSSEFYADEHQIIWAAMLSVHGKGVVTDYFAVDDELVRRKQSARIGGLDKLRALYDSVPHAANVPYLAQIVREKATIRSLFEQSQAIMADCLAGDRDCNELVDQAERRIFQVGMRRFGNTSRPIGEVLATTVDRIEARARGELNGLATGFEDLDYTLGGIEPGQLVIIAGRPSMGKTAFAMNLAENFAASGIPVFVSSIEQGGTELGERMLSGRSDLDSRSFKGRTSLTANDWPRLHRAQDELSRLPIEVCDDPTQTVGGIVSGVRRYARKIGQPCISIVDHIGMVDVQGDDRREKRHAQLDLLTRQLKAMAREIGMPAIVLSQLSRQVATREDKTPHMADLRESGALEQNADVVLLLHRPEYYDPDDCKGVARVIVGKNRNGMVGTVDLWFEKSTTKFRGMTQLERAQNR